MTTLLQREINAFLGIASGSRGTLTAQQTEDALAALDDLGDTVRDRIREAIDGSL